MMDGALRERNVVKWARIARADKRLFRSAIILVITYTLISFADISSTILALTSGNGTEANPFIRGLMNYGNLWISVKLILHTLICFMILWFPHRMVLAILFPMVALSGAVVLNNYFIAGYF